jgi:hypothetical protein
VYCRKLNTSPSTVEDKDVLKKPLCLPKVRSIDLHFPLGLEVTARNLKGVTIKDALDAIYKQYKKKVRPRICCSLLAVCQLPGGPLTEYAPHLVRPALYFRTTR